MSLKLGSTAINKLYLGSTEIKKAYLGATLVLDTTGGAVLAISGTPETEAGVDNLYNGFTVAASDGTEPYTYSLVGTWPAGISVDSATGVVSGTPSATGSFTGLSVRVTDGASDTADLDTFTLTVSATSAQVLQLGADALQLSAEDLTFDGI